MNATKRTVRQYLLSALAVALVGCGGGGGGSATTPPPAGDGDPIGGINGGGRFVAQGPISRFGSVFVNGVRYSTTSSTIVVGGTPTNQAALAAGQVVRVEGVVDAGGVTGRAERIEYENTLAGAIDSIDLAARTVTVLGQTLRITRETVFGSTVTPGALETLSTGNFLAVSALRTSSGTLVATRIDRPGAIAGYEVAGVASAVDTANRRFNINALTVDYSSASVDGFPGGAPVSGDTVYVRSTQAPTGLTLRANQLARRATGIAAASNDNVDLEGLVTRFASATDFDVNGLRVTTTSATVLVGDAATALRADALVDVEGRYGANGQLTAARVEVIPTANVALEGRLEAVTSNTGVLRLLGIEVTTNALTRFDDDDQAFSIASLQVGDAVQVAGYLRGSQFVATRVARDDDGGEAKVTGPATQLADPEFRIAGIRIVTDGSTEFDDIDRSAFFAQGSGQLIEVDGNWDGTAVRATEVEGGN